MTLYTFGGTAADVLQTRSGTVVPDYPIRIRRAGTSEVITALLEEDGITPISQLRSNSLTSGSPGAIRTFTIQDVPAIDYEYLDSAGQPVTWYQAARELPETALQAAQTAAETVGSKLDRTDGGTVTGPVIFTQPITAPNMADLQAARVFPVTAAAGTGLIDDGPRIQAALNLAGLAGGGTVIIPSGGTYAVGTYLVVKANTRIQAHGATMRAISNSGLLRNYAPGQEFAAYTGPGNITIEGGIWDANAAGPEGTGGTVTSVINAFTISHSSNVTLRDLTIRNVSGAHGVEINASRNVQVVGCTFEGFRDNTPDASRGFSEAVQLDYAIPDSGAAGPNDGTACRNILVQACTFRASSRLPGFGRAVGSHTSAAATWHESVRVLDNHIEATGQEGIRAYAWKNALIANNVISGTGAACVMVTGPDPTVNGYSVACQNVSVQNNTVTGAPGSSPVRVIGFATARPTGVNISGNTVTGAAATGIYVSQATAPRITDNLVAGSGSLAVSALNCSAPHVAVNTCLTSGNTAISVDTCTGGHVGGNVVDTTAAGHGVLINGGSDVSVNGNRVSAAKSSGIRVTASAARARVVGNHILRGGQTAIGVDLTASATDCAVINNDLSGSGWAAAGATALNLAGTRQILDWAGGSASPGLNLVS